jgi:MFS family permease
MTSILAKERTIAGPGFNRWLVPPAALAIHLCIGMAYGFSVFWLPLSKSLGDAVNAGTASAACRNLSIWAEAVTTTCDWRVSTLQWMYTLFFLFPGIASAVFGRWMERVGPRKSAVVAACCWSGGMLVSALGVHIHQIWLLWLGSGLIGGLGLGIGYISPVSILIKWFPDRRGMATGMAIMGFGGGAVVGVPLAVQLMSHFASPQSVGVAQTFAVMALIYFVFMLGGAFGYRMPPPGWTPAGWQPPAPGKNAMVTQHHVHATRVWHIPQFWLMWGVLFCNVTAGIGILGMASPMLQEIFAGQLIDTRLPFDELSLGAKKLIVIVAGSFVSLLSLFNIGGRFFWASVSDYLGRKSTYHVFFLIGCALYALLPVLGHGGSLGAFVVVMCLIVSMFGGGFATIPAYIADLFGHQMVAAIHGRMLTAWSVAGVFGPMLLANIREYQLAHGVPHSEVYNLSMYIMAGLLLLGLVCNALIKPIDDKHFMSEAELAHERALAPNAAARAQADAGTPPAPASGTLALVLAWLAVGLPLAWGIGVTVMKAVVFFK